MTLVVDADALFSRAVDVGTVPGVVALAVDVRGVIFEGAFGTRECGRDSRMAPDTIFAIKSMTKPVTAVATLQLVDQGRIGIDEPLGEYLPELQSVQVLLGFDSAGVPQLRPPRRAITLRHLLTHTAGFGYSYWNIDLCRLQRNKGTPLGFWEAPLVFDPGDKWNYSTGLDWAGRLVERVSGLSLEEYFRRFILDPLEMSDTSFLLRPDQRARRAGVHQRQSDGGLLVVPDEPPQQPVSYNGGGGLHSTGPDYLRFLQMLLQEGKLGRTRVLRPETVTEMARNQIGDISVGILRSAMPTISNDVEFLPDIAKKWGFGGLINTETAPSGRSAGSWSWGGLNNTYFWIDPRRHIAGLILTQILPFGDLMVMDLFDQFERLVYASQAE